MKMYTGKNYDVVSVDKRLLPCHKVYTEPHNWTTDAGRKQLALDILIDVLQDPPTGAELRARHFAAWLPHESYAAQLIPLDAEWMFSSMQVLAWLDYWFLQRQPRHIIKYTTWREEFDRTDINEIDIMQAYLRRWIRPYFLDYIDENRVFPWAPYRDKNDDE